MRNLKILLGCVLTLCAIALSGQAEAGVIVANRAGLSSYLSNAVTEDFESFNIGYGNAVGDFVSVLNSSTIYLSQGPGLVMDGVQFKHSGSVLQWNGEGYYGQQSKNILALDAKTITIDFLQQTNAFGLDLSVFSGYPDGAIIKVYGLDDLSVIFTSSAISLSSPYSPVFFGYAETTGIGRVDISGVSQGWPWSPFIDNVTFEGSVVPVPAAVWLLGSGLVGLAGLRRKLHK